MPTVIDSLVVELGLDPKKFTQGQREALESFKKTQDAAVRGGKAVEEQSKKTFELLGGVKMQALDMFAAFTGGVSLVSFATQSIHAGAAVGRLSRNLGVSVNTISKFQGLAQVFGGSAEGMASSFTSMSDALEGWKIGDMRPVVADFRALSAAGGTIIDINKGVEQTFLDIAKDLRAIHDRDPAMGGYWQRRLGLDPGLYDAMIQKGTTFNELLAQMRGLTDAEADAAGRLDRRWATFKTNATRTAQGFVLDLVDSKSKFNPLNNGSDAKDIATIESWVDRIFGTHWAPEEAPKTSASTAAPTGASAPRQQTRGDATGVAPASKPTSAPSWLDWFVTPAQAKPVAGNVEIPLPTAGAGVDVMKPYRESIAKIESRGSGNYSAIGPVTRKGDRAFGRYQVMGENIPEWTTQALGKPLTTKDFLASPEAQDKVFNYKFAELIKKYGSPQDAASAWLTGKPLSGGANLRDINGTSGQDYVNKFNSGLAPAPAPGAATAAAVSGATTNITNTSTTNINGPITIPTAPNADGRRIASDFRSEILKRQSFTAQADYGQE